LDFWDNSFDISDTTNKQIELLKRNNLEATFLIRPDVFLRSEMNGRVEIPESFERGLFLEITPSWADRAGVDYRVSGNWHSAESVFLSGYTQDERKLLIDTAFDGFKQSYGVYPVSVGAWWVDSFSVDYMYQKYKIQAVLIVADQYSTDNYQVWGQYFGYPYYPSKTNALFPAQDINSKIPVVMMQWAARDPINGYGKGVEESTLSVQANDYIDYHDLETGYFKSLLTTYLDQPNNQINQVVVGLENSYSFEKYGQEYENQLNVLVEMSSKGQIQIRDMKSFASIYTNTFRGISPEQIIFSNDPIGGNKKTVWYMNPFYRANWVYDGQSSYFRDVRQYINGQQEMCYLVACKSINFATGAIRVMDQVTNGLSLLVDDGFITDINLKKFSNGYELTYRNAAGRDRIIRFLPKDIGIDSQVSSIDSLILRAQAIQKDETKYRFGQVSETFKNNITEWIFSGLKFVMFVFLVIFIPGLVWVKFLRVKFLGTRLFFSAMTIGVIAIIFVDYFLVRYWLGFVYLYAIIFGVYGLYLFYIGRKSFMFKRDMWDKISMVIILVGSIYWSLPVIKSATFTPFGLGFWGPNGHDGIWHLAVAESIGKSIPPLNPIFSGEILKNYHYLYDVLLSVSNIFTRIEITDLLFRFYPVFFGVLIGLGVWSLTRILFSKKSVTALSLIFVYFLGSFGWIVEYFRNGSLSGESAFWVNQPISTNLNPPFALSLIVLILIFLFVYKYFETKNNRLLVGIAILSGSLIGIKIYAFILLMLAFGILGVFGLFKKSFGYFVALLLSILVGIAVLLPNYDISPKLLNSMASGVFIWDPWWFIHTMVEYPDRVGWLQLAQARVAYFERCEWLKYIMVEMVGLVLFIAGNLGIRLMVFVGVFKIKTIWANELSKLMMVIFILGMTLPMFIIQSGTAWNTIQFFYYVLPIAAIGSAGVLLYLLQRFNVFMVVIVISAFIVFGSINSIERAVSYFQGNPHAVIPFEELEALTVLKQEPVGIVLTYPYDKSLKNNLETPWPLLAYDSTAYVAALSGKVVYMEDEMQNDILGNDYVKRRVSAKDFFSSPNEQFLNKNNIKYIYLPKLYKVSISAENLGFSQIFDNGYVVLYRKD
jgi:hypothetical protein